MDEGHTVRIAQLWGSDEMFRQLDEAGDYDVIKLDLPNRWALPLGASRLRRVIHHFQPDVIHAHLHFSIMYAAYARWGTETPLAATFHDLVYDSYPVRRLRDHARELVVRRAIRSVDEPIAVSAAVARHYQKHLRLRHLPQVIYNGVLVKPAIEPGSQMNAPSILCPARLVPKKNHALLLAAFARLEHSEAMLTLAGDGAERGELERLTAVLGLADRVVFVGSIPHNELLDLMDAKPVVALTSNQEGFGIALAEAMASGCAVVATDSGPTRELIENEVSGLVVPAGNAEAIAKAIDHLLSDPQLRQRLGEEARSRAAMFSVDRMWASHRAVYERSVEKQVRATSPDTKH